ncbi:hypothetical protein GCM10023333_14610 [Ferrimonas pelagia]|uniref:Uncharacterized protein n=1 Tax=Ferrimonas pelagia TaxID=1177826 RepID=A0ABP9EM83_9GAMM
MIALWIDKGEGMGQTGTPKRNMHNNGVLAHKYAGDFALKQGIVCSRRRVTDDKASPALRGFIGQ